MRSLHCVGRLPKEKQKGKNFLQFKVFVVESTVLGFCSQYANFNQLEPRVNRFNLLIFDTFGFYEYWSLSTGCFHSYGSISEQHSHGFPAYYFLCMVYKLLVMAIETMYNKPWFGSVLVAGENCEY